MKRIAVDDIVALHIELENIYSSSGDPISPPGVKDQGLLEAAANRPWTTVDGQEAFRTLEMKAAILLWSLTCYHSFHNGNKRTAIATLRKFLERNDRSLVATNKELVDLADTTAALCSDRSDKPYVKNLGVGC